MTGRCQSTGPLTVTHRWQGLSSTPVTGWCIHRSFNSDMPMLSIGSRRRHVPRPVTSQSFDHKIQNCAKNNIFSRIAVVHGRPEALLLPIEVHSRELAICRHLEVHVQAQTLTHDHTAVRGHVDDILENSQMVLWSALTSDCMRSMFCTEPLLAMMRLCITRPTGRARLFCTKRLGTRRRGRGARRCYMCGSKQSLRPRIGGGGVNTVDMGARSDE